QMYAVRSLFVTVLLAALTIVWWRELANVRTWQGLDSYARVGTTFCTILLTTLFALVVMLSPTVSAGAVCQDKARGPLFHLFTTDLSDAEIVLGKLMARLLPLVGLIGCSVPVLFLSTLFGGIELRPLIGSFLILLAIAILGCSLSLVISVWAKRTYEVLLLSFTFWAVVLLSNPIIRTIDWLWNVDKTRPQGMPFGGMPLTAPPAEPDTSLLDLVLAPIKHGDTGNVTTALHILGIAVTLSMLLLVLAIYRVRRVTVRQAGQSQRRLVPTLSALLRWRGRSWLPRPPLNWNPVLWREWQRRRATLLTTITWGVYVLLASLLTARAAFTQPQGRPWWVMSAAEQEFPALVNASLVAIGLLLLSVTAVMSLVEERDRGSLDMLLVTPLPAWHILAAKWLASFRSVLPLAFFPALLAYLLSPKGQDPWPNVWRMLGLVLAYGAMITSVGLALATWIKQPGRALTLSVAIYVLVSISWLPVGMLTHELGFGGSFLALASPFFMVHELTHAVLHRHDMFVWDAWASLWTAAYPWLAACLFLLTLKTFERSLGRLTSGRTPPFRQESTLLGGWDLEPQGSSRT
ncbi:MAG TPA: ABC transporter permease subunit, partial [Gemmataceae bacterium]|nr:ABC transporter permease subunit [Gemmataceae bacterium]